MTDTINTSETACSSRNNTHHVNVMLEKKMKMGCRSEQLKMRNIFISLPYDLFFATNVTPACKLPLY